MVKAKECKVCEKEFAPTYNSTQKVCSPLCAIKLVDMDKQAKAKKARSGEIKRVKQKLKQLSMNDRPKALRAAQAAFNAFIRERDKGLPCISCGRSSGCKVNAGHYLSVQAQPVLRFDDKNVNLQCDHCNCFLSGNLLGYRKGLLERFGQERIDYLEKHHPLKKHAVEELHEIKALYVKKKKELMSD
jgi:hypothetical protein